MRRKPGFSSITGFVPAEEVRMKRLMIPVAALAIALSFTARADEALTRAASAASNGEWSEALCWYEIAAEDGDLRAKETIALMYLVGERLYPGIEQSVAHARAWYYRAQAQGSTLASRMLADIEHR